MGRPIGTKNQNYSIEFKNEIAKKIINHELTQKEVMRMYDIPNRSPIYYWIKDYKEHGTVIDNRGKMNNENKGKYIRKKKIKPEEMSHEELLEYVKATEDIKKLMAFLKKQKKNIR